MRRWTIYYINFISPQNQENEEMTSLRPLNECRLICLQKIKSSGFIIQPCFLSAGLLMALTHIWETYRHCVSLLLCILTVSIGYSIGEKKTNSLVYYFQ